MKKFAEERERPEGESRRESRWLLRGRLAYYGGASVRGGI